MLEINVIYNPGLKIAAKAFSKLKKLGPDSKSLTKNDQQEEELKKCCIKEKKQDVDSTYSA